MVLIAGEDRVDVDAEVVNVKVEDANAGGKIPDETKIIVFTPAAEQADVWQTPQARIETEFPIDDPPPVEPR